MKVRKKTKGNICFSHSKKTKKEQKIPGKGEELKGGKKKEKGEKNL